MDGAASGDHIDVVEWLHKNRREGCTIHALGNAIRQGHLTVAKWLKANRSEG